MREACCVLVLAIMLTGCFSPDVDVDTSGFRSGAPAVTSARRPRSSSSDGTSSASSVPASRIEDIEEDVAKLDEKLDGLKDDLKELKDRVKALEKKLD